MTILSMLYKGIPGDEQVYQCDFDGSGWSTPLLIPQIVTSSHPLWARYYDQTLLVAWRDVAAPHQVHAARYDGPDYWTWFGAVPGATTSAAPAGAAMPSPSSKFILAWKSGAADAQIHFASFDSLHWSPPEPIPGAGTSHSPSLISLGNTIHLVWKGMPGVHDIYHATYDGVTWSVPQQIPGIGTTSQPSLTTFAGQLVMAWKGTEGDASIYWSFLDATTGIWLPQTRIRTFETGTGPTLLEFAGRLHLLWKGVGDDYSLYMANFDGAFWWGQHQIPGVASSSSPTLAEYDPAY